MEEKNQNTEEKKNLTQEEIEDVQGGGLPQEVLSCHYFNKEQKGEIVH